MRIVGVVLFILFLTILIKFKQFKSYSHFSFLLLLAWMIKNIINTSCIFYPIPQTCIKSNWLFINQAEYINRIVLDSFRDPENGIRNLPSEVIDASKMMGSTKMQLLFLVKIPLALPVIMLGLNQTIMYGIAMLVIAALIGTNGLEQIVFIGLTDGNMGKGFIAGISMAIIAMIVDRITKTISEKRSEALGLSIK